METERSAHIPSNTSLLPNLDQNFKRRYERNGRSASCLTLTISRVCLSTGLMVILGCIHALLLAEATDQLVDIHTAARIVQKWGAKGQRTPAVKKFLPDGQLNPAHPEEFFRQQAAEDEILRNHPEYIRNSRLARTDGAPVPTSAHSSAFDVAKGLSYTRSTEAAELTRPSMIPWVVLGTVAFVALLNLVVVSLKLTAGLGHHRAATQRRPPHRGARSSKAKGRKTAAEPLHQCAAPSQPAAPLMKSKRKAKVGRATARGDGEVAALEGALAAVPRNAREGGVAAEERYVGEEKLEKWRQDAAEREARQEAAAEAARLAVLERAQQAAAMEAARVAAAADAREEAKAATTSPAPAPAATTPSASKFRANAKPWVPTSDAKACVRTVQPPPEPAMALATAMQEVVAPPATADALEVVADALEQLVAVGSEGGINGAAGPSEASKAAEVPDDYMCSITAEIMTDPVCASDGFTYEREAITAWLRTNDTSPLTGATLESKVLNPNLSLRGMIRRFVAAQAPTAL